MDNKPKILVSKCLGFANCRYDGAIIPFSFIETLKDHVDFVSVCPEEEIGLGTPRPTIRLISDEEKNIQLVSSQKREILTDKMNHFSEGFLKENKHFDGAILKAKSPSCGLLGIKVYDEKTGIPIAPSKGLFAEQVQKKFNLLSIEEEGRLRDYVIREHFLIKLYCIFRWNRASKTNKIKDLMDYHASHKYLFMCYNQDVMRKMGKIIALHKEQGLEHTIKEYEILLANLLEHAAKTKNKINAFLHVFGYFKNELSAGEKEFFLDQLEQYRKHAIPYHSISTLLEAWATKYEAKYLLDQHLFSPYPKALMSLRDSGKAVMK